MLIDKNDQNNLFELTPEVLFEYFPVDWRQIDDANEPTVTGDQYSRITVYHDKIDVTVYIELLFKPNDTWSLTIKYHPSIHLPVILNGEVGESQQDMLINLHDKLSTASSVKSMRFAPIVMNLARAMYKHRGVTKWRKEWQHGLSPILISVVVM